MEKLRKGPPSLKGFCYDNKKGIEIAAKVKSICELWVGEEYEVFPNEDQMWWLGLFVEGGSWMQDKGGLFALISLMTMGFHDGVSEEKKREAEAETRALVKWIKTEVRVWLERSAEEKADEKKDKEKEKPGTEEKKKTAVLPPQQDPPQIQTPPCRHWPH